MELTCRPDKRVRHRPAMCGCCGKSLKDAEVTAVERRQVHAKRGKDATTAAWVLPFFTGIAVHDAWKPYETFGNVAGHALCGAHRLREFVAVTETGTDLDKAWALQAIDALPAMDEAAEAARVGGKTAVDRGSSRSTRPGTARPPRPGSAQRRPARQAPAETARPGHEDEGPRGRLP
jgi:hypothetical protein